MKQYTACLTAVAAIVASAFTGVTASAAEKPATQPTETKEAS